jgi:catechol 2,3-dioxygenase-like lactoylglutathione lyase family enzyme
MSEPQQISVITLGVTDLAPCRSFYNLGFGWRPAFEADEILFYQMNGLMLGLWLQPEMEVDTGRADLNRRGAFTLGHNVGSPEAVDALVARLDDHGGTLVLAGGKTDYGGYRGYVADPDDHVWEIAFNPEWSIDAQGHVTFGH